MALVGLLCAAQIAGGADAAMLWASKVQPLLDVNCVKCHGPLQQKSGLELDTLQMLLKGGDDGAVVVAGKPGRKPAIQKSLPGCRDTHAPEETAYRGRAKCGAGMDHGDGRRAGGNRTQTAPAV